MTIFEMAQQYYPRLWDITRIDQLLAADKITVEEYTQITGQGLEQEGGATEQAAPVTVSDTPEPEETE